MAALLGLVTTGCDTGIEGIDHPSDKPVTLVVSDAWVQAHQGDGHTGGADGGVDVQARLASLQKAIDRLRKETGTGWVGRQDDVTGFLGALSGGSRPGTPTSFMDEYGAALFGVPSSVLRFGEPDTETVPGVVSTKATQAIGDVPVRDGTLAFTGRGPGDGSADDRVTGVQGRVYPGLTVGTTPTLTADQAVAAAAAASGGSTSGTPRLVVIPTGTGLLAWEVAVVGQTSSGFGAGLYYVDATTGALVDVRSTSAETSAPMPSLSGLRAAQLGRRVTQIGRVPALRTTNLRNSTVHAAAAPDANSVQLTGKDPLGRPITAFGVKTDRGYELVDTTTAAWDPATGAGGVSTHDAKGLPDESQLPGPQVVSPTTTVDDPDALAAQSYSHDVLDYYTAFGRDSWDDKGSTLVTAVHYGGDSFCNAFFSGSLNPPQMVYGDPCVYQGRQLTATFVDPDIAGHEITHGVTASSAGLLYSGQSGALNESFSDYFGNVIGNRIHGRDDDAYSDDNCAGLPAPTQICKLNPDGSVSDRFMLNGATFDDYLKIIDPGLRLEILYGVTPQDSGGVHYNSAIWNNALWSIRDRLAQIDGQPGTTSELVHSFDRAVYGALTTRLTPTSGYFDARAAVEQVIIDSGLDPVVLRVAREVFDQNKICSGCPTAPRLSGDVVAAGPQTQQHPKVSGDRVTWIDFSAGNTVVGYAASAGVDGGTPSLSASNEVLDAAYAGQALVTLDINGNVVRTVGSDSQTVETVPQVDSTFIAGLGGSDTGAAWYSKGSLVSYMDAQGTVTQGDIRQLGNGNGITAVATGGGTVAVGSQKGTVLTWTPGSGGFRKLGQVSDQVFDIATYGGNVLVLSGPQFAASMHSTLFLADGRKVDLTQNAQPFGAAMSGDYVVWSEAVGPIQSDLAAGRGRPFPETDLYLLSLSSGKIYDLVSEGGQQGFPSISGNRLVWQDAAFGGDDVMTMTIPDGM